MVLCAHKPTHITPTSGCPRWCESGRWSQVTGHRVVLGRSKNTMLPREPGPLPPSTWGRNRPFMFTENRTGQKRQAGLLPSGACPAPAPLHAAELPPQWDLASQGSLASQGAIVTPRRQSSKMEKKKKNRKNRKKKTNPQTLLKIGCLSSSLSCEMATSLLHRKEPLFCCLQTLCGGKKAEASSLQESVFFLKKKE